MLDQRAKWECGERRVNEAILAQEERMDQTEAMELMEIHRMDAPCFHQAMAM